MAQGGLDRPLPEAERAPGAGELVGRTPPAVPPLSATSERRPTRAELEAARGTAIPDVLASGLRVLFCGINPSLYSGATGHHFARPGNRFWPALYRAGFTDRQLSPSEDASLPDYGLGCTNLVNGATARADEVTREELLQGAKRLREVAETYRPEWVAVLGIGAYRTAIAAGARAIGAQPEPLGPARLWVLPNPSGINAHYQLADLVEAFADLRRATTDGKA